MCGITFICAPNLDKINIDSTLNKVKHRGPDDEKYFTYKNKLFFGFNRLVINDNSSEAMQPFNYDSTWLICNGEIFNWKSIVEKYSLKMNTNCDCEVIIRLFIHLFNNTEYESFENITNILCNELDGEFAFVLYEETTDTVISARDPYGVRSLFYGTNINENMFSYCSEMKGIHDICDRIEQFKPGYFMINGSSYIKYNNVNINKYILNSTDEKEILIKINSTFKNAVKKRLMSDREICCLLSGGLDSSLVAGLVSQHFEPYTLKTYSIGLKGSTDLQYASKVATHIKSIHTNIELTEQEFLNAIETVIKSIESYDTTTVRASVGNYLVSKYIKDNSQCKVVFNGDYADEVCGGYKYMSLCNDPNEFHTDCVRLVKNIHFFDSLRSDRCISSQGLEGRVPFADKDFVNLYLSIPVELRMSNKRIEKYMLRKAFDNENIIPDEILWRKKEAFSDGVSSPENSWHQILKNYIDTNITLNDHNNMKNEKINPSILKETSYYKLIFKKFYNHDDIIPYFWLPKYCGNLNDPSAREI